MVSKLRAVHTCLSDPKVSDLKLSLPPSLTTLYALTRLEPERIAELVRNETITAKTTHEQIKPFLPPPMPRTKKAVSRLNQLRKFMSKHREAMELEFADNPVLERTIPREMREIIEAAKERRQWAGRTAATTTADRFASTVALVVMPGCRARYPIRAIPLRSN